MKTNVVVAVFNVESEGYQALTELKNAVSGDKFFVSAAALVKKDEDSCQYLDGFDTGLYTADDAIAGGLLGMMLGVIGGPLGLLIGGSYGALVGMVIDDEDAVLGVSHWLLLQTKQLKKNSMLSFQGLMLLSHVLMPIRSLMRLTEHTRSRLRWQDLPEWSCAKRLKIRPGQISRNQ